MFNAVIKLWTRVGGADTLVEFIRLWGASDRKWRPTTAIASQGVSMPRIPYRDIPAEPPYVYRSSVHSDVTEAVELLSRSPSVVLGERRAMGVTRTLAKISWEFDNSRSGDDRSRFPVVVDFYPHAHRDLVENLALMRNEIVETLDAHFSLPNIEVQLYEFDALFHIWREAMKMRESKGVQLRPSRFRTRAEVIAKRIFTVGTGGLFDALELFGHVSLASVAAGGGMDVGSEGLGSAAYRRIGGFLRKRVAPRVSGSLRATVVDWSDPNPRVLGNAMLEFLVAFLINVNRTLKRGYLLLIIDSIDEVEDGGDNSERLRAAFTKLITSCTQFDVPAILGGREPSDAWHMELQNLVPMMKRLGPIDPGAVRSALISAGVDRDLIDRVMTGLSSFRGGPSGGEFAELWRREA